ncbi:carboxylesterase 2a [Gymnodraco acuticeps]|uniref:Carboxylesterase 2a n=1 Tax=Gymnodraco acuticeps TaxID=8218 RepID=A0A6P8T2K0_GYMAC|nr:carboxylesterase 2a [Gymnodraco acuticeps]
MKVYLGVAVDGMFLTDTAEELLKRKEVLESVLSVANIFNPAGASAANSLTADQYLKDAGTPEEIRDSFTEMIGDMLMALPVVTVAGYLSDVGVPVYMYEFAYRAEIHKNNRPSFVKADHADDVGFVFGGCFWNGHLKIIGILSHLQETLPRTMMARWSNFARTGRHSK